MSKEFLESRLRGRAGRLRESIKERQRRGYHWGRRKRPDLEEIMRLRYLGWEFHDIAAQVNDTMIAVRSAWKREIARQRRARGR